MQLDPAVEALLENLAAQAIPALEEVSVEEARAITRTFGQAHRQLEDVASAVRTDVDGVPVRIYRAEGVDRDAPVLIWFHGGGFVVGDTDRAEPMARRLANRVRARVVSVEYRLAPEHPYPAAIEDTQRVLQWADGERAAIAVGGDSAGANLAALMAVEARDRGIDLRHQLLVYPCTDLTMRQPSIDENAEGYVLRKSTLRWFYAHYLGVGVNPEDARVSPMYVEDLADVAPATVITAEFDPLRDDGNNYAARLRDAGVDVDLACHPGMIHGFVGLVGVVPAAAEAVEMASANLRAALA